MVNEAEKVVKDKYEAEGWKTIRCGAPDFLFIKVENPGWEGKIVDVIFVEVKKNGSKLTDQQLFWKKVLVECLNAKYKVERVMK